jgi:Holliday junction resolvase RusA-like endonuclease
MTITFFVPGVPVPKQSFRYSSIRNFQPERLTAWQDTVTLIAKSATRSLKWPSRSMFSVSLIFYLPDRRRRDPDNLSKAVLDACSGVIWYDDDQVLKLKIEKVPCSSRPGVEITVEEI